MSITKRPFGTTKNGEAVTAYTMTSEGGISVTILDFGATIQSILVPDRQGVIRDVVGGYDDLRSYEDGDGYQGAVVGRFGNRIRRGKFTLDGVDYQLACNNDLNHLHGGNVGFSHRVWEAEAVEEADADHVTFRLISPDGEENYPGTMHVTVEYRLVDGRELAISYKATTDKRTILNLTNHSYFNLAGFDSGDVFDHLLFMDADRFVEIGEDMIPTGNIVPVLDTPFDFRTAKSIGEDFDLNNKDLGVAGGFDHCMVFEEIIHNPFQAPRAVLYDPHSGRKMRIYTTLPCVQFYTANFMFNEKFPLKGGYPQQKQHAVCFETENMPDSMNHEGFTNCILSPGEVFESHTVYAFDWKE